MASKPGKAAESSKSKQQLSKKNRDEPDDDLEEKVLKIVAEMYKYAMTYQKIGRYKKAYTCYRALIHVVSTEPMVWMRMAECILAVLKNPVRFAPPFVFSKFRNLLPDTNIVLLNRTLTPRGAFTTCISNKRQEVDVENKNSLADTKIEKEEFTYQYADMCMTTSRCLLKDSPDIVLQKFASAIHAYIYMKRGSSRKAVQLCEEVLIMPPNFDRSTVPPYLIHYVQTLIIECNIKRGRFTRALQLIDRMPEVPIDDKGTTTPDNICLYNRTMANCGLGKFEEARKYYDMLIETAFSRQIMTLGVYIYSSVGKFEEFQDIFQRITGRLCSNAPDSDDSDDDLEDLATEFEGFKPFEYQRKEIPSTSATVEPDREARGAYLEVEEETYEDYWAKRTAIEELIREAEGF